MRRKEQLQDRFYIFSEPYERLKKLGMCMFSIFTKHLDQKEMLTKVWKLRLKRKEGRCFVNVYKVLSGESKGKYIAAPGLLTRECVPEYITTGSTANAALSECLKKIKNKRFDEIFQKFTTEIT